MQKVRKAVIPVAGFATRFLPASKAVPKPMLPIVDKPVIQYIVEQLVEAGIEDIIMVTNYHERAIEDHFDRPHGDLVENLKMGGEKKKALLEATEKVSELANFVYVRQKGPYGNGTPLMNVHHLVGDEPFIYTWGDEFFLADQNPFKQVIEAYNKYDSSILSSVRLSGDEDFKRWGYVGGTELEGGVMDVKIISEKPGKDNAPSDWATFSPYVLTPQVFDYIDDAVKQTPSGQELYLADVTSRMIKGGKRVLALELQNAEYMDSGTPMSYLQMVVKMAKKHPIYGEEFSEWLKEQK